MLTGKFTNIRTLREKWNLVFYPPYCWRKNNKAVILIEKPAHLFITSVRKTACQKFCWVQLTRHFKFLSILMHFIYVRCDQRVVWYVCLIRGRSGLSFLRQECGKHICIIAIKQSNLHVRIYIPTALSS